MVDCFREQKVKYLFGLPGAKIDRLFNDLVDGGPEVIVTRHEQNAAFMAAATGRLTGQPGVCIVTSGPGAANLATGLLTATSEGNPMVAIGGSVSRDDISKKVHQTAKAIAMTAPCTKYSARVESADSAVEILTNSFRIANAPRKGAAFVELGIDILPLPSSVQPMALRGGSPGPARPDDLEKAVQKLKSARLPVILAGMSASDPAATASLRRLLARTQLPLVCTHEGAGVLPRDLLSCFGGRIGLFRNQPGDLLLAKADVILTIGFDLVEYDSHFWNAKNSASIIHLSEVMADIDNHYRPEIELVGDMAATIDGLAAAPATAADRIVSRSPTFHQGLHGSHQSHAA